MTEDSDDGGPDESNGSLARTVPLDLLAAISLAIVAAALLLGTDVAVPMTDLLGASPTAVALRFVTLGFGLALLLFLPGYALVSVLFPGHEPAVEELDAVGEPVAPRFQFRSREGIDVVERITLAIGLSAVATPFLALALNFTPWSLRTRPLVVTLAGFVVAVSLVAAVVRFRLAPEDRFAPNLLPNRSPLFAGSQSYGVANVVLALGVLVAVVGIGYAVAVPKPGGEFTELYLLSENENGTLVADDYPDFSENGPSSLVVGVENHEGSPTDYTVVAELQRVEAGGNRTEILSERELRRAEVSLAVGESGQVPLRIRPSMAGPNSRLRVMLFEGSVPTDPTAASAYRYVDLWLGGNQPTSAGTTTSAGNTTTTVTGQSLTTRTTQNETATTTS